MNSKIWDLWPGEVGRFQKKSDIYTVYTNYSETLDIQGHLLRSYLDPENTPKIS